MNKLGARLNDGWDELMFSLQTRNVGDDEMLSRSYLTCFVNWGISKSALSDKNENCEFFRKKNCDLGS